MNYLVPARTGRRLGTLLRWEPARLFDDLMTWEPPGSEVVWSPYRMPIQVQTTGDGATITVDMPGVESDDLELTFEAGTLHIAGKRGEHVHRYRVALGDTIDPDAFEATLDKGVLTVHAHRKPEARPRRIAVTTVTGGTASGPMLESGGK